MEDPADNVTETPLIAQNGTGPEVIPETAAPPPAAADQPEPTPTSAADQPDPDPDAPDTPEWAEGRMTERVVRLEEQLASHRAALALLSVALMVGSALAAVYFLRALAARRAQGAGL